MMKSKIKKALSIGICAAALLSCSVALVACGEDDEKPKNDNGGKRSELIGGFENSESLNVAFTNDESLLGSSNEDGVPYIYTSDVYPLDTIDGNSFGGLRYNVYQKLRLKRDFSYEYTLELMVRIVGDSNLNLCKLEASTKGTFTYTQNDGENYTVNISDPTSGSEKRYGAFITGESNIYSWKISSAPNYVAEVERLLAADVEEGESRFDRYLTGKTVAVEKDGTERVLYNDVFYVDFMNDIAPYCSYDSSSVPKEEKPEVPDNPPKPPAVVDEQTGATLPSIQKGDCQVSLKYGDRNSVVVVADKSVTSATLDGVTVNAKTSGDKSVFEFPVSYAKFGETLNAKVGESTFSLNLADYLDELYPDTATSTNDMALRSIVANLINVAHIFGGGEALADGRKNQIYNADGNIYQDFFSGKYQKRDNMDVVDGEAKTNDFSWVNGALDRTLTPELTMEGGVPTLEFKYNLDENAHGKVTAKLTVGKNAADAIIEQDGDEYVVKATVASPLDYDEDVTVEIIDGGKTVSKATYSITRALAAAYLKNGTPLKEQADALWSLGKSAEWYADKDGAPYAYDIENGSYSFGLGEYGYYIPTTAPDYGSLFGTRIYVNGKIVDDNSGEIGDDGNTFTASRGAAVDGKYPFTVTLDGANIDGICVADDGNGRHSITVEVTSDSTINSMLMFKNVYGSINADCDVVIRGSEGATLTVLGTIMATGKLTVDGVNVKVKTSGSYDGVTCGALEIKNGGGLEIEYVGKYDTDKSGLKITGNAEIDGTFKSVGFDSGVMLNDDTAEQTFTVNGGEVTIDAVGYGVNGKVLYDNPTTVSSYLSRNLIFNGGVTKIMVGDKGVGGFNLCNITLNDAAELYVDVKHGNGFLLGRYEEFYDQYLDNVMRLPTTAKIKTNTANEREGVLSIKVHAGTIGTVDELILDGGNNYFYGNGGSLFETAHGAVITMNNCDVVFENGNGVSVGRAITAQKGEEVITVSNSTKVVFKNVDAPIACWGAPNNAFAKLINNGLIILDTYKCGLEQWQLNSWELKLIVENKGQVRSTNGQ